jgi:ssDNA-binding replication factor A large subunit
LEVQETQIVNTQYGSRVKVTSVLIADETGQVKVCLWGEQLNMPKVGDKVQIKGATVKTFKGENLLSLGRSGTLDVHQPLLVDNAGSV